MNYFYFFFLILIPFLPSPLIAQDATQEIYKSMFSELVNVQQHEGLPYYALNNKNSAGAGMDGSVFLDEEWQDGVIVTPEDELFQFKGRYNAQADEIQIQSKGGIKALLPQKIKAVVFGEQILIPFTYVKSKGKMDESYFELLVDGDVALLLKYTAVVSKGDIHPVLGTVSNEVEISIQEDFYYSSKMRPAVKLQRTKSAVLDALNRRRKAVAKYAKENKLGVKKKEDLMALFTFYNEG